MILSTHAIVGGAIASFVPLHPLLMAVAGFASHFAIMRFRAGASSASLPIRLSRLILGLFQGCVAELDHHVMRGSAGIGKFAAESLAKSMRLAIQRQAGGLHCVTHEPAPPAVKGMTTAQLNLDA
jgi:hypothetical protein